MYLVDGVGTQVRNELVVRIQPDEAMWMKMMNKRPGLSFDASPTFLDLSYNERYRSAVMPGVLHLTMWRGHEEDR